MNGQRRTQPHHRRNLPISTNHSSTVRSDLTIRVRAARLRGIDRIHISSRCDAQMGYRRDTLFGASTVQLPADS
jgi:hypothetical protein